MPVSAHDDPKPLAVPVSVQDIEFTRFEPPAVSARYEAAWLLVRLRGVPVGYLKLRAREPYLAPAALATYVSERLDGAVWEELVGQGLASEAESSNGKGESPPISVVVCTRDRPGELDGCLAALAAQGYPNYEVVVVDNASRDGSTQDVARRWSARCVVEHRPGLDWARNRGLAEAKAPIVAFTDDDARPDPSWLVALAAGFVSPDVHAVTGLVVPAELETRAQLLFEDGYGGMGKGFRLRVHTRRGRPMKYAANNYGAGCNMAFRRDALDRLGGFNPALDVGTVTGGGGDLDVFQRVIESDAAIEYRPDAVVRHIHRRSLRQLRRQLFDNGRGYSAVLWASFLRARGADRLRVVATVVLWFYWWHARRLARRLLRREKLPLHLILVELAGALTGPVVYHLARRRARRLASEGSD